MIKRILSLAICSIFIISALFASTLIAFAGEKDNTIEIVFTHDMHSYLDGFDSMKDGKRTEVGSLARIKTYIDEKKALNKNLILLDGGDFSMGTLYHTLFEKEALELRTMGKLGYDATTFGNHEFDFGSTALSNMLKRSAEEDDYIPPLVVCNIDWNSKNEGSQEIYEGFKSVGGSDYIIIEKNNMKIAVTGILGKDALACITDCDATVLDQVESLKRVVKTIKEDEDADMIICLSHSGTSDNPEKSEDEIYAAEVPELDVIISGHTHSKLNKPIKVGHTYIMSSGEYAEYVGNATLKRNKNGRFDLVEYKLDHITTDIEKNPEIASILNDFSKKIDREYLFMYNYTSNQVLAENDYNFEGVTDVYEVHEEMKLGNLMSDAFRNAAQNALDGKEAVDIAVIPSGTIRGTFYPGDITVRQAFESFSLGVGKDGTMGYPLIAVHLTGKELKNAVEVDASISDMFTAARLYMSGISFTYNPNRIILNKSYDVHLNPTLMNDENSEINDDELYLIVTDLYSGKMLGTVTDLSKGLLKIVPKDGDGNPYDNLEDAILYDENGEEVKAWVAIADYMASFEKNKDGAIQIPEYYSEYHSRKVVSNSKNPIELVKQPNVFFFAIIGIVILVLGLISLIVIKIVKRIRK